MYGNLAVANLPSDLLTVVIKQRHDREVRLAKAIVVSERSSQSAGANNPDAMRSVETEYLRDVIAQIFDVVANSTHSKLAEVTQVFADLRRV